MTDGRGRSPDALDAISELLLAGEQFGIGVTFEPDDVGWRVGYMQGMVGGDLATAYDLDTATRAALRPLMELGQRLLRSQAAAEDDDT
jgi:hypothetical protein